MKYSKTDLSALREIALGADNVKDLSARCGLSIPQTYKVVEKLRSGRLVETEEGKLSRAPKPHAALLADILLKSPYAVTPLSGSGLAVVMNANGVDTKGLQERTGLSQQTVSKKIREFRKINMLEKFDGYRINEKAWPELASFVAEYGLFLKYANPSLPSGSVVYGEVDGTVVFSNPSELDFPKTAFSRYGEYGLDFDVLGNYYCTCVGDPGISDLLSHSFLICRDGDWRLKMMTVIFYWRVSKDIEESAVPEILKRVSSGESVPGWPPLEEIMTRAEVYEMTP